MWKGLLIALTAVAALPTSADAVEVCGQSGAPGVYLSDGALGTQERCTVLKSDDSDVGRRTVRKVIIRGDYAATLYNQKDFAGARSTYITSTTFPARAVGSVHVRRGNCDGTPGVYVYARTDYRGRCSRFTADTPRLWREYVLANEASSIRMVGAYTAVLYRSAIFLSAPTTLARSDPDLADDGIGDDALGSLRVRPTHQVCGEGAGAFLYDGTGFTGACSRFTSTVGSLAASSLGEDKASSIRIDGPYQATLYADPSRGGASSVFTRPGDGDLGDDTVGTDRASSIVLTGPFPEEEPVRRVQVRLTTGDVSDAGTDDSVLVSLNQGNSTWVDYGRDDFERDDDYSYDVLLDGVKRFSDLKWLTVSKTGSDGWCLSRLEIIVNRQGPRFTRTFSPCLWLDNEGGDTRSLAIGFDALRGPQWTAYTPPVLGNQAVITSEELESRIAGIVGNALHATDADWRELGSNAVVLSQGDAPRTVHVVLKLFARVPMVPDPDVNVAFDLRFSCVDGVDGNDAQITLRLMGLDVSVHFPNVFGVFNRLGNAVVQRVEDTVPEVSQVFGVPPSQCPTISVNSDADVVFLPAGALSRAG